MKNKLFTILIGGFALLLTSCSLDNLKPGNPDIPDIEGPDIPNLPDNPDSGNQNITDEDVSKIPSLNDPKSEVTFSEIENVFVKCMDNERAYQGDYSFYYFNNDTVDPSYTKETKFTYDAREKEYLTESKGIDYLSKAIIKVENDGYMYQYSESYGANNELNNEPMFHKMDAKYNRYGRYETFNVFINFSTCSLKDVPYTITGNRKVTNEHFYKFNNSGEYYYKFYSPEVKANIDLIFNKKRLVYVYFESMYHGGPATCEYKSYHTQLDIKSDFVEIKNNYNKKDKNSIASNEKAYYVNLMDDVDFFTRFSIDLKENTPFNETKFFNTDAIDFTYYLNASKTKIIDLNNKNLPETYIDFYFSCSPKNKGESVIFFSNSGIFVSCDVCKTNEIDLEKYVKGGQANAKINNIIYDNYKDANITEDSVIFLNLIFY